MSIFPFLDNTEELTVVSQLPPAREWAWDIELNDFKLKNGKPYIVEGNEAVKIWAYKALKTDRFKHSVYSWNYGSELNSLIGSGYTLAAAELEAKRLIEECLMENPYIESIEAVTVEMQDDTLNITYSLSTIYGSTGVITNAY